MPCILLIHNTPFVPCSINSFRCSLSMILAFTMSNDALIWGSRCDGAVINLPQFLVGLVFPREIFSKGVHRDTGGAVYPGKQYSNIHYNDVIMSAMASQITSLTIVYSTVYSRRRSKKTSKLRVTGLYEGNSPVSDEFPSQTVSNAENHNLI